MHQIQPISGRGCNIHNIRKVPIRRVINSSSLKGRGGGGGGCKVICKKIETTYDANPTSL
jgi:hypothetical protein